VNIKRLIHESNLIESVDSKAEDAQSLIAWDWLYDWNMPLTHEVIYRVQKIITLNQPELHQNQRGHYRDLSRVTPFIRDMEDASIERVCPPWPLVEGLMGNWLLDFANPHKEFDPVRAHVRFEHIHPFVDGNGRTGRMLLWWHELKKGLPPTLFKASESRDKYYPLFRV
jgi:Fic family protein